MGSSARDNDASNDSSQSAPPDRAAGDIGAHSETVRAWRDPFFRDLQAQKEPHPAGDYEISWKDPAWVEEMFLDPGTVTPCGNSCQDNWPSAPGEHGCDSGNLCTEGDASGDCPPPSPGPGPGPSPNPPTNPPYCPFPPYNELNPAACSGPLDVTYGDYGADGFDTF
jgi:hypothetical protein